MAYLGKQPALQSNEFREEFNITSETSTIATSGFVVSGKSNYLDVYKNGVLLGFDDYTLGADRKTITLASSAIAGDIIVVIGRRNLTQGVRFSERRHEHTIANSETTVTFPYPLTGDSTDVYLNGVKLAASDFSINVSTRVISFTVNPVNGDLVSIVSREPATSSSTVLPIVDSNGGSVISESNGSVVVNAGTANIGSNALVVDSSGNVGIGTSSPTQAILVTEGGTSGDTNAFIACKNNNDIDSYFRIGRYGSGTTSDVVLGNNYNRDSGYSADDSTAGVSHVSFHDNGELSFGTGTAGSSFPSERMRISTDGNLILQEGCPIHVDTGRTTNIDVNGSTYTSVLDFSTLGASNVSRGFYLVTAVREGASVGTHIVLLIGVSSSSNAYIYQTLASNVLTAQMSGSQLQLKMTSSGNQTLHISAIPIGIHGNDF